MLLRSAQKWDFTLLRPHFWRTQYLVIHLTFYENKSFYAMSWTLIMSNNQKCRRTLVKVKNRIYSVVEFGIVYIVLSSSLM